MAEPQTSILEKLSEEVARDVAGEGLAEGDRGFDISMIITLIMGIVQAIMQKCPAPAAKKRIAFRKPERRQEAALWKETYEQCNCAGMKQFASPIFNRLKVKGSQLDDPSSLALIKETEDDRNLLI